MLKRGVKPAKLEDKPEVYRKLMLLRMLRLSTLCVRLEESLISMLEERSRP